MNSCIIADVRAGLVQIRDAGIRVQCVVTSPPYYGLRDYKTPPTIWGGAPGCRHEWVDRVVATEVGRGNWAQAVNGRGEVQGDVAEFREPLRATATTGTCAHCGAWRGQLGLEPLRDCLGWARGEMCSTCYICHMREVFARVGDVLRDDGVCFLNIGDSYNVAGRDGHGTRIGYKQGTNRASASGDDHSRATAPGLKPKDLVLVPERLALALQVDGWYVRSRIAWAKDNPMPESVTDRPTNCWEHIWLVTKSERYYWDAEAVKEAAAEDTHARYARGRSDDHKYADGGPGGQTIARTFDHMRRPKAWDSDMGSQRTLVAGYRRTPGVNPKAASNERGSRQNESFSAAVKDIVGTRNMRNLWRVNTQPYPGKHYATFPENIPTRAVLAGTSAHGACSECGTPWERVVENGGPDLDHQRACGGDANGEYEGRATKDYADARAQDASATKARILAGMVERVTTGWERGCKCATDEVVPCVVCDPFMGSGTVGQVAQELGRNWIGVDLDERNLELQAGRVRQMGLAV